MLLVHKIVVVKIRKIQIRERFDLVFILRFFTGLVLKNAIRTIFKLAKCSLWIQITDS